ncbi:hypothetical protein ACQVT0_26805 [Bacillus toyonensis]
MVILEVNQPSPLPRLEGTRSAFARQTGSNVWDRRICSFLIPPHKERSVRYHGQMPCVRYYCSINMGNDYNLYGDKKTVMQ